MNFLKSGIAFLLLASACVPLEEAVPVQQLLPVSAPVEKQIVGIAPVQRVPATVPEPHNSAEAEFITGQLNALQPRSITENREYCGYVGLNPAGEYAITLPVRGNNAGCTPNIPPASLRITASYHTHAAYAPRYDSEAPSAQDVEGDISEGINGYVSPPGGRVWFVNSRARQAELLCGLGCVVADPRFQPDPEYPILNIFTLGQLRARH